MKSFGNWLVQTRRIAEVPFRFLERLNVEVEIRHVRHPLNEEEFARLLEAARSGKVFRRLSGNDRRMLYLIASYTGLRASECASLTVSSFHLDAHPPHVGVEAGYSKHRKRDTVPLHPDLVQETRNWFETKLVSDKLWPGKWAKHNEAGDMIRHDLDVARERWISEAQTEDEKLRRETADFLRYRDSQNQVADFHSLRHRFVTELIQAGVQPAVTKELARHSTITLTMDRYSHTNLKTVAPEIARLNLPTLGAVTGAVAGGHACQSMRTNEDNASGNDNSSGDSNCLENQESDGDCGEVNADFRKYTQKDSNLQPSVP